MRGAKSFRGPKHEEAERALHAGVLGAGHLITHRDLRAAWHVANGLGPVPREVAENRWERLLQYVLETGAAFCERRKRAVYWGLRGVGPLPLPAEPARARQFGEEALQRCERAERALRRALDAAGTLVTATALRVAYAALFPRLPVIPASRVPRWLEPAVADGRVVVTRAERAVYYGVADRPDLKPPGIASAPDLSKVEEALRRAVALTTGAVPVAYVDAIIDDSADLTLASTDLPAWYHLQVLVRSRRAQTVRPIPGSATTRVYYTTPDGPTRVASEVATHIDVRRRACKALWRASGGRPFTTAALRRFARVRRPYSIPDDPPHGWACALQHLASVGELAAIREPGRWTVRWAPADEWAALSAAEQRRRLADDYREPASHPNGTTRAPAKADAPPMVESATLGSLPAGAPPHDVGFVSGNRDAGALVARAKERSGDDAHPRDADVLRRRPVSEAQVHPAARDYPHLARTSDLRRALHEASRRRNRVQRTAVVRIGSVGRVTYFDVEATPTAIAYVAFVRHAAAADVDGAATALARLEAAADLADARINPVPRPALCAWASAVCEEASGRADALEGAAAAAELLDAERADACEAVAALRDTARTAAALRDQYAAPSADTHAALPSSEPAPTPEAHDPTCLIDVAAAWAQVVDVAHFGLARSRQLYAWLGRQVPTVRVRPSLDATPKGPNGGPRPGRPVIVYLDRVAFAAFAAMRWGGPRWGTFAAHGASVLGPVRTHAPFARCLESDAEVGEHAGAASALGLLDDPESRAALAAYLARRIAVEREGAYLTPMPALVSAAYGLARKPAGGLATALAPTEHRALVALAAHRADDHAGRCARRVLEAWAESWTGARLFEL